MMSSNGIRIGLDELIALAPLARGQKSFNHLARSGQGNYRAKGRGRGIDFNETRSYQAGDDLRHMEWRVTARTGRPHIKLYQAERERPVCVLVDFNPSMYFGSRIAFKSVVAAKLAAVLAWTIMDSGDRVGSFIFSGDVHQIFPPKARLAGVLPVLKALSQFSERNLRPASGAGQSLSQALKQLKGRLRPGARLVIISDFRHLGADLAQSLRALRRHHDILAYQVCDPLELVPPPPQIYTIGSGQKMALLDLTDSSVHQAYQGYCTQSMVQIKCLCEQNMIPYQSLTAATDLPGLVQASFLKRD